MLYNQHKYYIIEVCDLNLKTKTSESLGFIDYDHASGGYPSLGPDYMAHKFWDAASAKENAIQDVKVIASLHNKNINTMSFKILEYGCIRQVSQTSAGFYK